MACSPQHPTADTEDTAQQQRHRQLAAAREAARFPPATAATGTGLHPLPAPERYRQLLRPWSFSASNAFRTICSTTSTEAGEYGSAQQCIAQRKQKIWRRSRPARQEIRQPRQERRRKENLNAPQNSRCQTNDTAIFRCPTAGRFMRKTGNDLIAKRFVIAADHVRKRVSPLLRIQNHFCQIPAYSFLIIRRE